MYTKIVKTNLPEYLVKGEQLVHGRIYEGSDQLLYVGAEIGHPDGRICAVGIDNGHYVQCDDGGEDISFREINATVSYC